MNCAWRAHTRSGAAPRRILMTADAVGGVWQYCLELATGLCRAGSEVWLAVMGPAPTQEQLQSGGHIEGLTILHGDFRLEWMGEAEADVTRAGDWLMMLAHELRPDLVHLNGYAHAALPWRCPVVVVAHSCVLSWWRAVHGCEAPAEWNTYRDFVSRGLDSADLVIAPTLAFLRRLQSIYRFEAPSCAIWNGRSPHGTAADKQRVVMTAGRLWDAAKNLSTLTEAADGLPWPVWVAGDGTEPERAHNVMRLGRLGDDALRQRLGEALIFALPARYEPFGLTALEAAQARCALVLGDIDTQRELWNGAALFVPPGDSAALGLHLRRLLEEPQLASALGALAHRRARRFTSERMVRRYLRAYATVAAAAPRRPAAISTIGSPFASVRSI